MKKHLPVFSALFFFALILLFVSASTPSYAILGSELLTKPWILSASKNTSEKYQLVDPNALKNKTTIRLTFELNGTCLLGGDASALVFDQPFGKAWHYVSLSKFVKNCHKGEQIINIPLANFTGLDTAKPVGTFHIRIWHRIPYKIEIKSAVVYNPETDIIETQSGFGGILQNFSLIVNPTPTPTLIPLPTAHQPPTAIPLIPTLFIPTVTLIPSPTIEPPTTTESPVVIESNLPVQNRASWSIQSVSSMKETKDRVCNQRSTEYIRNWVKEASELGVNYIAIETPYENPTCGDAVQYASRWIREIRNAKLKVWHRHMPLSFEGIYNMPKTSGLDFITVMKSYIVNNPEFFAEGDIFTPIPEPQNGGIRGITYCAGNVCQFSGKSHFNAWLRTAMDASEGAFSSIGLGNKIKIGYYGFDGFVAWGDNNPDWNGILEDATVLKMGNITIDHYPEIVGDTMENDLDELERRYPNIPIIIGEWGTITSKDPELQVKRSMHAAKRASVVGFNYWHLGVGGYENLINDRFERNSHFDEVQSFFKYSDRLQ